MFYEKISKCICGWKISPPHKGHEYLIRFAAQYAIETHVVVDCVEGEIISPVVRKRWLEETIPGVNFYAFSSPMPQDPSDTPDFWDIWVKAIFDILPVKPDVVVASMAYGVELARRLGCDFVPVDMNRESIGMSATRIKSNIYDNWDYLLPASHGYFLKKLCLLGPESTGKSTAGKMLAKTLDTVYVPEYAEGLIRLQNGDFKAQNVDQVIQGQIASENALTFMARKIMVCDSSAITTSLYAKMLFNQEVVLDEILKSHAYHMYALFYPDTAYVGDVHRQVLSNPVAERLKMFHDFEKTLQKYKLPYRIIKGGYAQHQAQLLSMCYQLTKKCVAHRCEG